MEPDFSGWLTKYGLKCTDGRRILAHAFQQNVGDGIQVPLVWQHLHDAPGNVLGHLQLTHKDEGVRCDGFFNDTPDAQLAKSSVQHKDITRLSVYANGLVQRGSDVLHGNIREGSLVLSGANPGAFIDYVNMAHADGDDIDDGEAIIYTDLAIDVPGVGTVQPVAHQAGTLAKPSLAQAVALSAALPDGQTVVQADGETLEDIIGSFNQKQTDVFYAMLGAAMQRNGSAMQQSGTDGADLANSTTDPKGGQQVTRNTFDQSKNGGTTTVEPGPVLSHSDLEGIFAAARKSGSLKDAVDEYALAHGITNIDFMFPDAKSVGDGTPDWISRRQAWVANVLGGTRHTPFSRIKSMFADITMDEARARGYIKGAMKREEFFGITKRTTTPQTIYKKQKLDRDDIVDITDFDVVTWLKAEMRMMLDEEVARAVLIGDGRDVADPDKINEVNIRPVLTDADMFVTRVNVNLSDANSTNEEIVDSVMTAMQYFQGSGQPTLYTARSWVTKMLLTKDGMGRRLHSSVTDLADAMGVGSIVTVDVMESMTSSLIGIIVNLSDYAMGMDRGGEVNFFDDFDIDYNKFTYLYETRLSGALIKYKSAIVVNLTTATMIATITPPTFVKATGVVTIPTQANVTYVSVNDTTGAESAALTAGAQAPIAAGATVHIRAKAAGGYSFADNASNNWSFQRPAS